MSIFTGIPKHLRDMFIHIRWTKAKTGPRQDSILMLEAPRPAQASLPAGVPSGLFDIHSHILWGIDDGAKDLATSIAMIQMAYETAPPILWPHPMRIRNIASIQQCVCSA